MSDTQIKSETIREYLLGRISDEKRLEEIEDLLFSDDEFCDRVELAEDKLINEYVFGELNSKDHHDFEKTLKSNSERNLKVTLEGRLKEKAQAQAVEEGTGFFDSVRAFFAQPLYAGAFGVLLIAALAFAAYLLLPTGGNELAELQNLYANERPHNSRISDFEHAPYVAKRSSDTNEKNKNKLRLIETKLLEAVESAPNAEAHHALGVFYLTQRKFEDSVDNLKKAVELEETNSKYRNDLGAAYFEFAKNGDKSKQLESFARANEEFTKAFEQDETFLPALFNKSLVLEELNLPMQAEESWKKYLEKDANSKWAEEARKHLEQLRRRENSFKTKEGVLGDFLAAFREKDEKRLWQIHCETKGVFNGVALHQQLTKRYLLARKQKDELKAKESLKALKRIGELEKEKHADFFYADLADYYSELDETKIDDLLNAKELLSEGVGSVMSGKYTDSINSFGRSKTAFLKAGNRIESNIAELWSAEMLPDVGKIEESRNRLNALISVAENKNYKIILPAAYYWLGISHFRQRAFSFAIIENKRALHIAKESENSYEAKHANENLGIIYNFLGEYSNALNYLSSIQNENLTFFSSAAQVWRELFTIANLLEKNDLNSTAVDFATESLNFSKKYLSQSQARDNSSRVLVKTLVKREMFVEALLYANAANSAAMSRGQNSENVEIIAYSFLERANVKRRLGKCDKALADFRQALAFYKKTPETTFNLYGVYKGRLLCLRELNRQPEFQNELKTILELSEEYRRNIREDNIRQAFFESEQIVFDTAIYDALAGNKKRKAFEFLETSKARSLLDFVRSDKSIVETEKEFSAVSKPLSLDEIQKRMPENVQIVQYSRLEDKLAIWVVENEKFELFEKQMTLTELENKIDKYRKNTLEKAKPENLEESAKELFKLLIPDDLDKGKTLCLVLDKSLHQIPFSSLVSPDGKYLIEDFSLIYSPSSSVFVIASENANKRQNSSKAESLLSIGNPRFDREENPDLADLPNAEIEASKIAENYSGVKNFIGEDATKRNFLNELENAEIIHFAGHFVANGQSSSNSKLVFTDEDLRAFEFSDKKLGKAKLVVLSACETAYERINKSEGAIGIGRTFLAMGAPQVVASNWKVDSEATKDLMISFHKFRREDRLSSIDALRKAQLEMLKNENTRSPYYWSAFSVVGGFANY